MSEQYRPLVHLTSERGWINDPNGLVFFNGYYHQFYQYYPHDTKWGAMHWGHQISQDLVNWHELSPALYPDEFGMCFSGSAVVDWNNSSGLFEEGSAGLLAFYTAYIPNTILLPDGRSYEMGIQQQALAYSNDGFNWKKYNKGRPIISARGNPDFRDPKVFWHEESKAWVMVVACGQHLEFYRSSNAVDWQLASEFGYFHGLHSAGPWECPDLFPLTLEKTNRLYWVLVVGIGEGAHCGGAGTQYFVGDFDGHSFRNYNAPQDVLWLDYGRDYYATQSFSDEPNQRRIVSSWMNNHQYSLELPTTQFRGSMTFPRELFLFESPHGLRVGQRFVDTLDYVLKLIQAEVQQTAQSLTFRSKQSVHHVKFDVSLSSDQCFMLDLFDDNSLAFEIQQANHLVIVRSIRIGGCDQPRFDQYFPHDYQIELPISGVLSFELLIDHGATELLINDGQYSFTQLVFPRNTALHLHAYVDTGELNIANFKVKGVHHGH